MFTVGLTGGIGSGKSTVAEEFAKLGIGIIDTDVIAHQLTAINGQAIPLIVKTFGTKYLTPQGALDRVKMRQLIFSNQSYKKQLEDILHPLIRQEALRLKEVHTTSYLIMVVPLLIESKIWQTYVDRILVVDCSEDTQIQRVMQRSGLTDAEVRSILKHQISREDRLKYAQDIILNDSDSLKTLHNQIRKLHHNYLKISISQD